MSFIRLVAAGAVAVTALAISAAPAHADAPVACAFLEISASKTSEAAIDADLKPLEKKLRKPPFTSYNTFRKLGGADRALAPMKSETLPLKVGSAAVILRDVEKREGKKPRVELGITMDDTDGKRVIDTKVSVDGGDYVVLGRSLPNGDGHFLAMTCKL
jgi:hypothetical protein